MILRVVLTALALCLGQHSLGQSVPILKDNQVTGSGFVVSLPPDVLVETAATVESLHGFYIELPPLPKETSRVRSPLTARSNIYRYIAFDTKWDVGDMPSLEAVVEHIKSNVLDNIPTELVAPGPVTLEENLPTRLGTLPARRLVIRYKNTAKEPAVRQVIVGYNARKDASAIIYLLTLNTTAQNFQEDLKVFSKVLSGFKLSEP
jgi:hypothetical protein